MPPAKKKQAKAPSTDSKPSGASPSVVKPSSGAAQMAALVDKLSAIKGMGDSSIVLGSSPTVKLLGVVPTGAPTLDAAIGRGGYPFGRITVLSGGEGTGKTTHALHAIANVQKMGGLGLYIDLENKLDLDYAASLGVDISAMAVARPGYAERTFELAHRFIASVPKGDDVPIVVVLDSINACVPKSTFDSEDYSANAGGMGAEARFFSKAVSKIVQMLGGRRIAFLAISQPRDKLTQAGSYKEKITGGSAWKFYAALAIDLKKDKEADVKVGGVISGHGIIAECIKNQVSKPYRKATYHIVWGSGIDYEDALMKQAAKYGVLNIGTVGGWCDMPEPEQPPHEAECASTAKPDAECDCGWKMKIVKWQSVSGFRKLAEERPELLAHVEDSVKSRYK